MGMLYTVHKLLQDCSNVYVVGLVRGVCFLCDGHVLRDGHVLHEHDGHVLQIAQIAARLLECMLFVLYLASFPLRWQHAG